MKHGIGLAAPLLMAASLLVGASAHAADANPADLKQADKFLADLPKSCGASRKSVEADGSVTIRIKCEDQGKGKKLDGVVAIKDGIVTRVE